MTCRTGRAQSRGLIILFAAALAAALCAAPAFAAPLSRDAGPGERALAALHYPELTAGAGVKEYDNFGRSVAISGNTALVGVPWDDTKGNEAGAVYVFTRSGRTWTQQTRLTLGNEAQPADWFGWSVAIDGDTALIGAYGADGAVADAGAAYVVKRSGAVWGKPVKLSASDGADGDHFGIAVAVSGGTALVGAWHAAADAISGAGAAYVFTLSGGSWAQRVKLSAGLDAHTGDRFGGSVALSGTTALIGAQDGDTATVADCGVAYVFTGAGPTWAPQATLAAPVGDAAAGESFGSAVAISGGRVLIGCQIDGEAAVAAGAAYTFVRSGTTWNAPSKLIATDAAADDAFGWAVGLSGRTALAGAPMHSIGAKDGAGSAWVFLLPPLRPVSVSPAGSIAAVRPTFKWKRLTSATTYEVRVYRGGGLLLKKTGRTGVSWRTSKRLPRRVGLTWMVRGRNAAGLGPWSAPKGFRIR